MCGSQQQKEIQECKGIRLLCQALHAEGEIHVAGSGFAHPRGWIHAEHVCSMGV